VAQPKRNSRPIAYGQHLPRAGSQAVTTLICQFDGCTVRQGFKADGLIACTTVARQNGWSVSYDGPGHGWVLFCPKHARKD
jgi:hypothetical protein